MEIHPHVQKNTHVQGSLNTVCKIKNAAENAMFINREVLIQNMIELD